jgi:hypothetical protein
LPTSQQYRSIRHDTAIQLVITLTPYEGIGFNLQEAGLTVRLTARLPDAPTWKVNGAAAVLGPWLVGYDPAPGDVDTIGTYDVQVTAIRANGKQVTLPTVDPGEPGSLTWRIGPDLDNT